MTELFFSSLGGLFAVVIALLIFVLIIRFFSSEKKEKKNKKEEDTGETGKLNGFLNGDNILIKTLGVILGYGILCLILWAMLPGEWQAWQNTKTSFLVGSHAIIILILILNSVFPKEDKDGKVKNGGWIGVVSIVLMVILGFSAYQEFGDKKSSTLVRNSHEQNVISIAPVGEWSEWISIDQIPHGSNLCVITKGVGIQSVLNTGEKGEGEWVSQGKQIITLKGDSPGEYVTYVRFTSTTGKPLPICRTLAGWRS